MPTPSSDTVIQRPDLGQLVMEFITNAPTMGYIGLEVLPIFTTSEQTATYPVIPKEALLSLQDTKRAMRGKYPRSDYVFEEGYYATSENGWEELVDDRERRLYANKFDAEMVAVKRATDIILRSQEKRVADLVFSSTNFTANSVTNEWDDSANATPIDDIKTGKETIRAASGMLPTDLIISYSTYEDLKRCDQIIDLLKYTFPMIDMNQMTTAQLAKVLDVQRVLVGGAVYNSAKKGQDASIANLWSNEYAMLTKISSGDLMEPSIGRTFLWTDDSASNTVVETYREEESRGDVYRVRHDTSEALIASRDSSGTIVSNISQAVSYLMDNITT